CQLRGKAYVPPGEADCWRCLYRSGVKRYHGPIHIHPHYHGKGFKCGYCQSRQMGASAALGLGKYLPRRTVPSVRIVLSCSGLFSMLKGSADKITMSATLLGSRLPLLASRPS